MKRLLLIGLGRWGTNHLRILKSMPIELFVADHDPKRLDEAEGDRGADQLGVELAAGLHRQHSGVGGAAR